MTLGGWIVGVLLAGGVQEEGLTRGDPAAPAEAAAQQDRPPETPPVVQETPPERPLLQEEPPPRPSLLEEDLGGFIDFEWLELHPRVGIAVFGGDFEIDPSPHISLLARAPMPWLSPDSNPGGDYFGVFAEVSVLPSIERNLNPAPDNNSGTAFLINFGFDYTFLRNQSLLLMVQGGVQYGYWGGIADLDDGLAGLAGLDTGIHIGSGLTITAGGQAVFADDMIFLGSLGLLIEF